MKRAILAGYLGGLLLFSFDVPTADAGGVAGTKERITFEGLVGRHSQNGIPGGYDGFGWGAIDAVGKGLYKDQGGFQAVVHGKVAAVHFAGTGDDGIIVREDLGLFSLRKGHFAAFGNVSAQVVFNAYKKGVLVGTKSLTLPAADTVVEFDRTFSGIDKVVIEGESAAMDDLRIAF
jgi:hypothetical protein